MDMKSISFDGVVELNAMEDGKKAMIADVVSENGHCASEDGCMFVRLHSWDETMPIDSRHVALKGLLGKRIRITIETVKE